MKDALLDKRSVRLTVYDFDYFFEEKREQIVEMLTELSGLHVKIVGGGLLRRKFYAYFDDVASANTAASAVVRIACCESKIRVGAFDVTDLVRNSNKATPEDLRLQKQVSKTKLAKEANSIISAIKRSKTEQHYKDVEKN